MKKHFFTFTSILFLVLLSLNSFGQNKIKIETENRDSVNAYGISEFYFVHQIFADAFFLTNLHKQLSYDEMEQILKTVLYKIDKNNNVTVIIKQNSATDARLVFFIKEETKEGTMLALTTNFHLEKREFTNKLDSENSLARWYFIKGNKLVYRKDLYSEKTEKEKKKEAPYKLINLYLFDNNFENDAKVKGLIDDILQNEKSEKLDILYAKLYLGELYLLNNEIEKAEKEIIALKEYFEKHKGNGIPTQYSLITQMAETELELIKRMKN